MPAAEEVVATTEEVVPAVATTALKKSRISSEDKEAILESGNGYRRDSIAAHIDAATSSATALLAAGSRAADALDMSSLEIPASVSAVDPDDAPLHHSIDTVCSHPNCWLCDKAKQLNQEASMMEAAEKVLQNVLRKAAAEEAARLSEEGASIEAEVEEELIDSALLNFRINQDNLEAVEAEREKQEAEELKHLQNESDIWVRCQTLAEVFDIFDVARTQVLAAEDLELLGVSRVQSFQELQAEARAARINREVSNWIVEKKVRLLDDTDGIVNKEDFVGYWTQQLPRDSDEFSKFIDEFIEAAQSHRDRTLVVMSPGSKAATLRAVTPKDRAAALAAVSPHDSAAALAAMSPEDRAATLTTMSAEDRVASLAALSSGDIAATLAAMTAENEAASLTAIQYEVRRLSKLAEVFTVFDLDGSSDIEAAELMQLGQIKTGLGWSPAQNQTLLKELDTDSNRKISCDMLIKNFARVLPQLEETFDAIIHEFRHVACAAGDKAHTMSPEENAAARAIISSGGMAATLAETSPEDRLVAAPTAMPKLSALSPELLDRYLKELFEMADETKNGVLEKEEFVKVYLVGE